VRSAVVWDKDQHIWQTRMTCFVPWKAIRKRQQAAKHAYNFIVVFFVVGGMYRCLSGKRAVCLSSILFHLYTVGCTSTPKRNGVAGVVAPAGW
jgi:hypothetical protein